MRASGSSSNLSGASAAGQPTAQQQQLAMQQLAMQQQLLMQQQAAAQAGARAPSSAGGMQLPPTAPGATIPAPPGATLPVRACLAACACSGDLRRAHSCLPIGTLMSGSLLLPGRGLQAYTVFGMDATTKQLKPFQLPPDFVAAKKECEWGRGGRAAEPGATLGSQLTCSVLRAVPPACTHLHPCHAALAGAVVTTHIGNPAMHPYICQEYIRWVGERQTAQAAGAAKRPKLEPGATGGAAASVPLLQHQVALQAMGGARPPLYPAGMMAQQLTAQAQAAQAQARLQAQLNLANQKFAPIVRPATEEEKQFAPKQRLQVGAFARGGLARGWASAGGQPMRLHAQTAGATGWRRPAAPAAQPDCFPVACAPPAAGAGAAGGAGHEHRVSQGYGRCAGCDAGGSRGLCQRCRCVFLLFD